MKILILCSSWSPYVQQLWTKVKKKYPDISYSWLTAESSREMCQKSINLEKDEEIYYFRSSGHGIVRMVSLLPTIRKLPQFDIIHSLWMEPMWGEAIRFGLRKKCKYWFSSVGGSDLYRNSKIKKYYYKQRIILNNAQMYSSENEETRDYFYKVYGNSYKNRPHPIIRFGVDIIDEIILHEHDDITLLKHELGLPSGKIIVMCGHNANQKHNHIKMIESISALDKDIRQKCFFVFPMTYGGTEEYIHYIENEISHITSNYLVIRKYMTIEEMAKMAILSDIMIHVQDTDQLSSTMMSHMFCGNIVIAGAWLPYQSLTDAGVKFISIKEISALKGCIEEIIPNIAGYKSDYRTNRDIVYKLSSWEYASKDWYNAYRKLMESEK